MTGQEIVDLVKLKLATPAGLKKVAARRRMIELLRDARKDWMGTGRPLRIHNPAVLAIDQTRMRNAKRVFTAKVLVAGNHVADVELDPTKSNPRFVVHEKHRARGNAAEHEVEWKKDRRSSDRIAAILRSFESLPPGSAELQIQHGLVKRLDANDKRRDNPELVAMRPVVPLGLPTEIATSINLKGDVGTGNVDILARTYGEGRRRDGGDFIVLELKQPSFKAKQVPGALRQAIQYAAALTIEANALVGPDRDDAAVAYRQFFSDDRESETAKYAGKPIVVHAVVVLPDGLEAAAARALSNLALDRPLIVHEDHRPMRVGALLFKAEEGNSKSTWKLADGPDAFRWVVHENAWRPDRRR